MKPINALLFALTLTFTAYAGTESGGGGGVVWVEENRPVLMDFFTVIKDVNELPNAHKEASRLSRPEQLTITRENEETVRSGNPAFAEALDVLEHWSKLPFDVMSGFVLGSVKKPLRWSFTEDELSAPPFYLAPALPAGRPIEVAAYYSGSNVSISLPVWNKLNLLDQKALIIHETLRQVQIGYKQNYNDESLQRATAIYTLCRPSGKLNYYMFYLLNNSPENADTIYGEYSEFIKSYCRRIE